MNITFPHLGNTYIAAKVLFEGLGVDYTIPPLSSKKTLEIGCLYSPDDVCLPFKIMIGNYVESIQRGADTVLITGSCGPCRFGEYCELQKKILLSLDKDIKFIVIDEPAKIGIREFLNRLSMVAKDSKLSKAKKIKALSMAVKTINLIDNIEKECRFFAGFEKNKGEFARLLKTVKLEAIEAKGAEKTLKVLEEHYEKLKKIEIDNFKNPIKIGIIGEIYTIIDPLSNMYIEDILMNLGVSTRRTLYPSWWVKNTVLSGLKINFSKIYKESKEYLGLCIGGHARECIGEAILNYKHGFDGLIQIFPVGCMPEIVSKAILPDIERRYGIPILSLVVDEMTGEAGYYTRVEAFLDLIEGRKKLCI
ncbi:2-hydroxyacyl-CoA dehydratase [Thermobrachium celere]|uniref:Activator of (R)-2-hydroxyglutaryl-CoA dehydratase n=1 Tax=Thermobrachium celere DSM 8682 TaxID=941824 RepID=R7RTI1_9CLOT|nr:2-hydroxyacyl-CoA dehydratase [Thermobrachium celere]GFR34658.1 2-hydroxyglutaryl-CoA dehydratase [Thermobrachium celere]CDF59359.1 Activator of (R)-2-hydroxyglutaryl-CoA dehydratase [Thermobrachium celere DSM 8682]